MVEQRDLDAGLAQLPRRQDGLALRRRLGLLARRVAGDQAGGRHRHPRLEEGPSIDGVRMRFAHLSVLLDAGIGNRQEAFRPGGEREAVLPILSDPPDVSHGRVARISRGGRADHIAVGPTVDLLACPHESDREFVLVDPATLRLSGGRPARVGDRL